MIQISSILSIMNKNSFSDIIQSPFDSDESNTILDNLKTDNIQTNDIQTDKIQQKTLLMTTHHILA